MLIYLIGAAVFLVILERIIPDQKLPQVKGWWNRVVTVNIFQLAIVWGGGLTWDRWFQSFSLFRLRDHLPDFASAVIAYLLLTFIYYVWHRVRHDSYFLWNTLHQFHHSPSRIETITSFYKHPLEIVVNSILIGSVVFILLGLSVEAGAQVLFDRNRITQPGCRFAPK